VIILQIAMSAVSSLLAMSFTIFEIQRSKLSVIFLGARENSSLVVGRLWLVAFNGWTFSAATLDA
jgi:hypothetical protein